MQIDHGKCVACGNCIPVCPMGAIYIDPAVNRATVNLDECVECYTCHRGMSKEHLNPTLVRTIRGFLKLLRIRFDPEPDVCPTDAIAPHDLTWPRVVRRAFIEYKRPLGLGDWFIVRTWIHEIVDDGVQVHFEIIKKSTGKLSCDGYFDYTMVNTKTGRAESIPDWIKQKYSI